MDNHCEMTQAIEYLKSQIEDPREGLPYEVFELVTEITPMVNVDLLVRDRRGNILLSWRDDKFCGSGWHVPGGIVRWREKLETRIQLTAMNELGVEVEYNPQPVLVKELIDESHTVRSHFISFTYDCTLKEESIVDNQKYKPGEVGYLAWHTTFPENMIEVHSYYEQFFRDEDKKCKQN